MERIDVKINPTQGSSYPILIGENLLDNPYEHIRKCTSANRFLIVTNDKVHSLYGNKLASDFSEFIILPDGEEYKSREILGTIIDKALKLKLERKDAIIAFGGGVIGDMAGYAAAVWMRGIDFVQIPTTLLACVDSSVGGKTGINIKEGKNLVGAFHSPKLVIIDSDTLLSLPKREFNEGMAEVIKHAFLFDEALLELIEAHVHNNTNLDMDFVLKRNCELKAHIVEIDYKEQKERMFLNFGHTIGHSVENAAGYGVLLHGEAVSIGMIFAIEYGIRKGITKDKNILERAKNILSKFSLPISIPDNMNLKDSIKLDKKRSDDKINFVFLESIGKPCIEKVSLEDILK